MRNTGSTGYSILLQPMDQQFSTPMMRQYEVIKKDYLDCLLFYRMGDFYELFLDDAHIGAKVLDITLTSRSKGKEGRIPMAGVPYHAVDSYLAKLVKAGYKVAICEQMTEPNKRGIIEREVVRVVTPGTILDEKALDKKENNFIISVDIKDQTIAIAACDISTGYFQVQECNFSELSQTLHNELGRINPSECILSEELYNTPEILKILNNEQDLNITCFQNWHIYETQSKKLLKQQFKVNTLEAFGIEGRPLVMRVAAALLGYLKETQKEKISHITTIRNIENEEYLIMDKSTMINLELFSTIREHDTKGTFISVLDKTTTAMGGRCLRSWVKKPLAKKLSIIDRYDAIEELLNNPSIRKKIKILLEQIADIERMIARLSVGIGNARDLVNLKSSLVCIVEIKEALGKSNSKLLRKIEDDISELLPKVIADIEHTLVPDPPVSIREGGMIQKGIDNQLDKLHSLVGGGKEWIAQLEIEERKKTGINSLKIRFNKVFGFYIEVTRSNAHLVPKEYMRKQTLVNGERFITPDLKKQEEMILSAEDEIHRLEYTLFNQLLSRVLSNTECIQTSSFAIATLDCLISFAELSLTNKYVRPDIDNSGELSIVQGRHPVVETLLSETQFVPNDVHLNTDEQKAAISVVDRIFVRSGASDVITSGLSTFMVEMVETAYILRHTTRNSLIIMDEIGRGTSTYDGISIAWAVAEYLVTHEKIPAKTLFATHYHELQKLADMYPKKIHNYHMSVVEENNSPVFLHTFSKGGASASFGVAVAKLAGIPEEVVTKASKLLQEMEYKKDNEHPVISNKISSLDLHSITPLNALNLLAELQQELKNSRS